MISLLCFRMYQVVVSTEDKMRENELLLKEEMYALSCHCLSSYIHRGPESTGPLCISQIPGKLPEITDTLRPLCTGYVC